MIAGGLVIPPLTGGPFHLGHMAIADVGTHPAVDLAPGHTQKQTIGGKTGQLGVGGDVGIAVDQIIAKQPVGAIIGANLT